MSGLSFVLPGPLRDYSGDRDLVRVSERAATVAEALALLWRECPAVRDRILNDRGELRAHVNVFVDGESVRYAGGLGAPVPDDAEIVILPAVSGG